MLDGIFGTFLIIKTKFQRYCLSFLATGTSNNSRKEYFLSIKQTFKILPSFSATGTRVVFLIMKEVSSQIRMGC
jgi:hypothetical protein